MTITKTNNAEGGTTGTAVTTSNSGATSGTAWDLVSAGTGGALTFDAGSAVHGSLGYKFAPASGQQCVLRWTGFNDTTGVVRFYCTAGAVASAAEAIFRVYTSTGGGVIIIAVNSSGQYVIQDSTNTSIVHTTATAAAGDRIEFSWTVGTTTSNGSFNFALYRGDTMTATETQSGTTNNLGTTNWDRAQFGKSSTTTWTSATSMDDLAAASGTTTFFGPASTPPTANAGPDQSGIAAGATVTLDGSGSTFTSPDTAVTYAWTQTAGTTVTLSSTTAQKPTFTAPSGSAQTLAFSLTVTGNVSGLASTADTVNIGVLAAGPTLGAYVWNGTAWVHSTPNVWNGTAWVACDVAS